MRTSRQRGRRCWRGCWTMPRCGATWLRAAGSGRHSSAGNERRGRPRLSTGGCSLVNERPTWLIVGLGNPGQRYAATRHNIGFMVVDHLARKLEPGTLRHRFDSELIETRDEPGRIVLQKPQTYMNLSGIAVAQAARWYRVPTERILIIYDDLDLPFGRIRLRPGGSSAGHKGLQSVIEHLGTDRVPRLRVGIGRPAHGSCVSYVRSRC